MKQLKALKSILGILIFMTLITSCNEEEFAIIGKLEVSFSNNPSDLVVYVRPAENPEIVISPSLKTNSDGKLTYELNYGNYILQPWSSSTFFGDMGFQIKGGETTSIYFDSNNTGYIK